VLLFALFSGNGVSIGDNITKKYDKMNLIKKILLIAIVSWAAICVQAATETVNGIVWTYTVSDGYYIRARTAIYISNSLTVSTSGWVYLKVPMDGSGAVIEHTTSSVPFSTSTITYIPLYWLNTTGFVTDYRGAPQIQMWE
jgi:hypothetical protein